MLKILHASDFHLDAPFSGLSPEKAAQRRAELRTLPKRMAQLCREGEADLLLLAGDLFDSHQVYPETKEALVTALGETGCPVAIAPGNHDYYGLSSPYAQLTWPSHVHIFKDSNLTDIHLPEKHLVIWGCAFQSPNRSDSPLAGFTAPKDGACHIGLVHGDTTGGANYGPISQEEIAQSGLTYLALGHIHAASGLQRVGNTHWAYPGCPQGRGFDELGDKGCSWITISEEGTVEEQFVPLSSHRYRILELQFSAGDPLVELQAQMEPGGEGDVVRLMLKGACSPEGMPLEAMTKLASTYFDSVTLFDHTQVKRDVWARAEEDTLTGLFLRQMQDALSKASEEERPILEQAVRFGLAALEGREEP